MPTSSETVPRTPSNATSARVPSQSSRFSPTPPRRFRRVALRFVLLVFLPIYAYVMIPIASIFQSSHANCKDPRFNFLRTIYNPTTGTIQSPKGSNINMTTSHITTMITDDEIRPSICLVYDRPPRTASSTAGLALQQCWSQRGFYIANQVRVNFKKTVAYMLSSRQMFVAAASNHVYFDNGQYDLLLNRCDQLFYVTSTRPMKDRLISYALGTIERHTYTLDRNISISEKDIATAEKLLRKKGRRMEESLENYPYRKRANQESEIRPDYIIRHDFFAEDLSNLLDAFSCESHFQSVNVHHMKDGEENLQTESEFDAAERLKHIDVPLNWGDATYKRLRPYADVFNEEGLRKAARLSEQRMWA